MNFTDGVWVFDAEEIAAMSDQMQNVIDANESTTLNRGEAVLADQNLIAETFPRVLSNNNTITVTQSVYFGLIALEQGEVVAAVYVDIGTAGSGMTAAYAGIYDKSGNRLATSADASSALNGTTNIQSFALTSNYTVPERDTYYAAVLFVGGTQPVLRRGSTTATSAISPGVVPYGRQTGQSTLPNPATIGTSTLAPWIGVGGFPHLWKADHESGDLSAWNPQQNSGNPPGTSVITTAQKHSGTYGVLQSIDTTNGTAGTRMFRRDECRKFQVIDYSCWYYIPATFTITSGGWGLNVMQWKSKSTAAGSNEVWWAIHMVPVSGNLRFWLHERRGETVAIDHPQTVANVPLNTWVNLRVRVKTAGDNTGYITSYQDGVQLDDIQNVQTAWTTAGFGFKYNQDWSVDAYGRYLSPRTYHHYIDDATQDAV